MFTMHHISAHASKQVTSNALDTRRRVSACSGELKSLSGGLCCCHCMSASIICWACLDKHGRHAADSGGISAGLTILDMGQHMLSRVPGSHLIIQILVPGLEERARATAPLASLALSPGGPRMLPDILNMIIEHPPNSAAIAHVGK